MWINALREAVEEANKQFAEPPQVSASSLIFFFVFFCYLSFFCENMHYHC